MISIIKFVPNKSPFDEFPQCTESIPVIKRSIIVTAPSEEDNMEEIDFDELNDEFDEYVDEDEFDEDIEEDELDEDIEEDELDEDIEEDELDEDIEEDELDEDMEEI